MDLAIRHRRRASWECGRRATIGGTSITPLATKRDPVEDRALVSVMVALFFGRSREREESKTRGLWERPAERKLNEFENQFP